MKRNCFLALAMMACATVCAADDYVLRVLTFEDADVATGFAALPDTTTRWSSLIDSPQTGGSLLYGPAGMGDTDPFYYWYDGGNTFLSSELLEGWGAYCFWNGGHAVSHYWSADIEQYSDYTYQLTVYRPGSNSLNTQGGGHNGSNHFCIHYGYHDHSGYSSEHAPSLTFADGVARVIDHMYVTNTTYALGVYLSGNGLSPKIKDTDWVRIEAYGYASADATTPSDTASFYLVNGSEQIIMDWTKFDLSSLGAVAKVELNITGSSDNGYGYSQPAYFAFDDVAVRFPKDGPTALETPNESVSSSVQKVWRDGKMYIQFNGSLYTIMGEKIQ